MPDLDNPPAFTSQNQAILAHFSEGHRLTGLEALRRFGVIHLPRRIRDLKDAGHVIADEWVRDPETGKRFKRWRLERRAKEAANA